MSSSSYHQTNESGVEVAGSLALTTSRAVGITVRAVLVRACAGGGSGALGSNGGLLERLGDDVVGQVEVAAARAQRGGIE
jgi:hypothetical protein